MDSALFHIAADGSFSEMKHQDYDDEDHIQRLLAKHPEILGGVQYRGIAPRRWALIRREMGVPDGAIQDRRWSLDHLYVDQDSIPTLVEVKRRRDTRSRREVIGQMFDYAADGPSYWPLSDLRESFAATHKSLSPDPAESLKILLGDELNPEEFWDRVEVNMRSGHIRLIFLVDDMPPELLRIVEFLARQLRDVEVYAVEVRQHVGATGQLLSTRVLGQTQNDEAKIIKAKPNQTRMQITEWFDIYEKRNGPAATATARQIYNWADSKKIEAVTTTAQQPGLAFRVHDGVAIRNPFAITPDGKVYTSLGYLINSRAFSSDESRQAVEKWFRDEEFEFNLTNLISDIRIPVSDLMSEEALRRYFKVLDKIVSKLGEGASAMSAGPDDIV